MNSAIINNDIIKLCNIIYGIKTKHYMICSKIYKPNEIIDIYTVFTLVNTKQTLKLLLLATKNHNIFYFYSVLEYYIINNKLIFIKLLCKYKKDILDYIFYDKYIELAINYDNIEILVYLLKINSNKYTYCSLLNKLAKNGKYFYIKTIIDFNDSSINILDNNVFSNACYSNNIYLVSYLSTYVSINSINVGFNIAVLYKNHDVIKYLINKYSNISLLTGFKLAIKNMDKKTLDLLFSISSSEFYIYYVIINSITNYKLVKYLLYKFNDIHYTLLENSIYILNDIIYIKNKKIYNLLSIYLETCSICLEKFPKFKTQCNHYFHKECLYEWLKTHNTCPICRIIF